MNSDELIKKLGQEFYEIKRLVSHGFVAYGVEGEIAKGETVNEALQNLLALIEKKRKDHERITYES